MCEGRPRQLNPDTPQNALLTIERQGIGVLGHRDVGEQPWRGEALRDGLRRQGSGLHPLATCRTGVFGTDVAQDVDARGNDVELLACLLPDALHRSTAAGALLLGLGKIVQDLDAREPLGQRPATALAARVGGDLNGWLHDRGRSRRGLGLIEQPQLVCGELLAARSEALGEQQLDLLLQTRDLGLACL